MLTAGRIDRTGQVVFGDASISVWEDGISTARAEGGWDGEKNWERLFKRDVFARIVQTLNRLGWTVAPWEKAGEYRCIALNHRTCHKGDLKGELSVCGRHIEFKMWQGVNTPTRPDHGGRYEWNKEDCAPYLLRLEMIRTRRRISDYLCNVFSGYAFVPQKISSPNPDPLAWFNSHWDGEYERRRGVHRFDRGPDGWPSDKELGSWKRTDADGALLTHGATRWIRDRKGRLARGKVYGGINGMWAFIYGPGNSDHTHLSTHEIFSYQSGMQRKAVAPSVRAKRLKSELMKSVAAENFERAAVLRDILRADSAAGGTTP